MMRWERLVEVARTLKKTERVESGGMGFGLGVTLVALPDLIVNSRGFCRFPNCL
jgi:hypothetical protein